MIEIDGSQGEGGGQILRSSLSLSILTKQPIRIDNLRAKRRPPGLKAQHLAAVRAAAAISEAEVSGDALHSQSLTFAPKSCKAGEYTFPLETAGSSTLVFQTVALPLALTGEVSRLSFTGGTHNTQAPPLDFLERTYLPVLEKMGIRSRLEMKSAGFYPAGGGEWELELQGVERLNPVEFLERGPIAERRAVAYLANLSHHIGERELQQLQDRLNWSAEELAIEELPSRGPGNALVATLTVDSHQEVITGFGEKGVSSERVADAVADAIQQYQRAKVPVGIHLADQLLLPMALAGKGSFLTHDLTQHTKTNAKVIQKFLPVKIGFKKKGKKGTLVTIEANEIS
ncbi:RNA 3'-terminal phosphate cyclase [Planctomycetales bacterium 10988]|nr:RNA 3'-terminal phosphate cyclase [Planctomycetales bacterium 10988]